MLPEGQYLQVAADIAVECVECGAKDNHVAVTNEVFFYEDDVNVRGIDAVVRFVRCGHVIPGATASPVSVAVMLNKYEPLMTKN